MMVSAAIERCL